MCMSSLDALDALDNAASRLETARKQIRANTGKVAGHIAKRLDVGDHVEVDGAKYQIAMVTWPVEVFKDGTKDALTGRDAEAVIASDKTPRHAPALMRLNETLGSWAVFADVRKSQAPDGYSYKPSGDVLTLVGGSDKAHMALEEDHVAFSEETNKAIKAFVAHLEAKEAALGV